MSQLFVDNIKGRTGGAIGAPAGAVVTGIVTATGLDINGNGDISGTLAIGGNVSIGGTLTYEDVTNIDAVGIITARSGVSIADSIFHTGDDNTAIRFPAADTFTVETGGSERLRVNSSGSVGIGTNNPQAKLSLHGSGGGTFDAIHVTNSDTGVTGSDGTMIGLNSSEDFAIWNAETTNVVIAAGNAERLRITSGGAAIFKGGLVEKYENAGTTLGAQTNNPLSDGNVILFTGNESGNNTINFTGVHATLSSGETVSFTAIITPNNSGVINAVQIDGQSPAGGLKWSGGSAPTAGSSGQDIYTFQILKTGTGATNYTVYGAAANYA